jgi:hypothetical protein
MSREIRGVDDNPHDTAFPLPATKARSGTVVQALSTRQALVQRQTRRFDALVSDMGRREAALGGHSSLEEVRRMGSAVTFFLFAAGGHAPESVTPGPGLLTPPLHPAVPRHA